MTQMTFGYYLVAQVKELVPVFYPWEVNEGAPGRSSGSPEPAMPQNCLPGLGVAEMI